MDGVVNLREAARMMKCLGFRGTEEQVRKLNCFFVIGTD
jgi:hypothetical protein